MLRASLVGGRVGMTGQGSESWWGCGRLKVIPRLSRAFGKEVTNLGTSRGLAGMVMRKEACLRRKVAWWGLWQTRNPSVCIGLALLQGRRL